MWLLREIKKEHAYYDENPFTDCFEHELIVCLFSLGTQQRRLPSRQADHYWSISTHLTSIWKHHGAPFLDVTIITVL